MERLSPTDNGFSTKEAESASHAPIVALAREIVRSEFTVIDYGAGNGELLYKIQRHQAQATYIGVESNRSIVPHPSIKMIWDDVMRMSILPRADLAIFMPGRLTECDTDTGERFLQRLDADTRDYLLLYGYGDWLDRTAFYQSVVRVLDLGGWQLAGTQESRPACQAYLLERRLST